MISRGYFVYIVVNFSVKQLYYNLLLIYPSLLVLKVRVEKNFIVFYLFEVLSKMLFIKIKHY